MARVSDYEIESVREFGQFQAELKFLFGIGKELPANVKMKLRDFFRFDQRRRGVAHSQRARDAVKPVGNAAERGHHHRDSLGLGRSHGVRGGIHQASRRREHAASKLHHPHAIRRVGLLRGSRRRLLRGIRLPQDCVSLGGVIILPLLLLSFDAHGAPLFSIEHP